MMLTDYTRYDDALRHFSKQALWDLFDGDREKLNIGFECLDRHDRERIAVRIAKADGSAESHTFGTLSQASNQFANHLARLDVTPGERVAIMLEPCFAFYVALFGTMKAGCIAVPLFTLFGPDGLALRLDDCTPRLLLIAPEKADIAPKSEGLRVIVADQEFIAALAQEDASFTPATGGRDIAMYQYTSGTTRELPEAVKHGHQSIVTVMIAALYATGIRSGDKFMCPSSPAWGHGLWHGTLAPLALGITTASYAGPFKAERLLAALEEFDISNLSAAATHYRMMKRSGAASRHSFALEKLSFTGEPIDSNTAEWAEATFGHAVCSMYGTTEIGVILVDYPGAADHKIKTGSLGKPVPAMELAIMAPDGSPCPPGTIGEIMVKRGENWFPTKDLGRTDDDGYYYHAGRADDVIISAGWTMSAVEIEDVLLKHPDVAEAAAIGVADDIRGQVVKAFIVSTRTGDDEFRSELQEFTKQRLSAHEYPRIVAFADQLPKTPAGKVNRKVLRDAEQSP